MLYDVFNDLYRFNREFNRLFHTGRNAGTRSVWPSVNIYENDDEYVAVAKVPGLSKEDITLTVKDNTLKISGTRKHEEEEGRNYHLRERLTGDFERSFMINEKVDADKISAELKNGLLLVRLPKAQEVKPRTIAIN